MRCGLYGQGKCETGHADIEICTDSRISNFIAMRWYVEKTQMYPGSKPSWVILLQQNPTETNTFSENQEILPILPCSQNPATFHYALCNISPHNNHYSEIKNVFFHGIFYDDINTSDTEVSSVRVTGEEL